MNVLLFMASPGNAKGGMEKHFSELANGLARSDIQVFCMAAPEHIQSLDARIIPLPLNSRSSRNSPKTYFQIFRILRTHRFDVVHAQGSKAAQIIQRITPLFRKTAFVTTIHNFKNRYPKSQRFDRLIAVSRALAMDIGYSNVSVVYNGLEAHPTTADAVTATLPAPSPTWLSVGRLVPAKGFDELIKAFQYVKGSLLIAGSGPELNELNQQIRHLNLNQKVRLLGHIDDIPELMKSTDAVVIASRREGFSYAFAEALLANKPVVATDVPIANEFLPDDYIIPAGASPEEFARHLNINLESAYVAQTAARKRARAELTIEAMTQNTITIYRACLER